MRLLLKLPELLLLLLLKLLKNRDRKGQPNKQLQSSADRKEQLMPYNLTAFGAGNHPPVC